MNAAGKKLIQMPKGKKMEMRPAKLHIKMEMIAGVASMEEILINS